jgi:DNA-binding YbaB/EbfC family protein
MSAEPPDLGELLRQAQRMSEQLAEAQARVDDQVVEGRAGGGAVRIAVSGGLEFRSVAIDPAVVDPSDLSLLEDLVLGALHDAMSQIYRLRGQSLGAVAPDLLRSLGSLPGLGVPTGQHPVSPGHPSPGAPDPSAAAEPASPARPEQGGAGEEPGAGTSGS